MAASPLPTSTDIEVPASAFRALVAPEEMQRLRQPDTVRVVVDLLLIWAQVLLALSIFVIHPAWWTFVLAFVLVAGGQHGLILATHEFAHASLFPQHRRLNDFLGTWLFGGPAGVPLAIFRHRHFRHHRTYSTEDDPKTVYRHDYRGMGLLREIARSLSGVEFVSHLLEARALDRREAAAGRPGPSTLAGLVCLCVCQGTVLLLFAAAGQPWLYFVLWLLPLVTLAELFQKIRATMEHRPLHEHQGAAPGSGFYGDTPGPFVRTVRASGWERLFVCKLNFCFHAEHHLWPQVAYQHLPSLRARLEAAGAFEDPRFGREETYFSTLYKLWRGAR
jgi:fatty acid desaturase